jgi:hypothetical protein
MQSSNDAQMAAILKEVIRVKHGRPGHCFQGRYGAKLVAGDRYILGLTRYIHLNPVKVKGMEPTSSDDKRDVLRGRLYSSYRRYAGLADPEPRVDYRWRAGCRPVGRARQRSPVGRPQGARGGVVLPLERRLATRGGAPRGVRERVGGREGPEAGASGAGARAGIRRGRAGTPPASERNAKSKKERATIMQAQNLDSRSDPEIAEKAK